MEQRCPGLELQVVFEVRVEDVFDENVAFKVSNDIIYLGFQPHPSLV